MPEKKYTRAQLADAAQLAAILTAGYVSVKAAESEDLDRLFDRVVKMVLQIVEAADVQDYSSLER